MPTLPGGKRHRGIDQHRHQHDDGVQRQPVARAEGQGHGRSLLRVDAGPAAAAAQQRDQARGCRAARSRCAPAGPGRPAPLRPPARRSGPRFPSSRAARCRSSRPRATDRRPRVPGRGRSASVPGRGCGTAMGTRCTRVCSTRAWRAAGANCSISRIVCSMMRSSGQSARTCGPIALQAITEPWSASAGPDVGEVVEVGVEVLRRPGAGPEALARDGAVEPDVGALVGAGPEVARRGGQPCNAGSGAASAATSCGGNASTQRRASITWPSSGLQAGQTAAAPPAAAARGRRTAPGRPSAAPRGSSPARTAGPGPTLRKAEVPAAAPQHQPEHAQCRGAPNTAPAARSAMPASRSARTSRSRAVARPWIAAGRRHPRGRTRACARSSSRAARQTMRRCEKTSASDRRLRARGSRGTPWNGGSRRQHGMRSAPRPSTQGDHRIALPQHLVGLSQPPQHRHEIAMLAAHHVRPDVHLQAGRAIGPAARASAGVRRGFQHGHAQARIGQCERAPQPGHSGPDDQHVSAHARRSALPPRAGATRAKWRNERTGRA